MKDYVLNLTPENIDMSGYLNLDDEQINFFRNSSEKYNLIIKSQVGKINIERISGNFLEFCDCLESVEFGDGIFEICEYAFANCRNLKSVKLPKSIEIISSKAFSCTPWLKEVKEKDKYLIFGKNVLFGSDEKIKDVKVPDNVKVIAEAAYNDSDITSVEMNDNVIHINRFAFNNCKKLESIKLSNNLDAINYETFCDCNKLNHVILPKGIKRIEGLAFAGCEALDDIILPEGLEKIDYVAFEGCKSLKYIEIPNSITEISETAFEGCEDLLIKYKGTRQDSQKLFYSASENFKKNNIKIFATCDIDNYINKILNDEKISNEDIVNTTEKYELDYLIEKIDNGINSTNNINTKLKLLTIRENAINGNRVIEEKQEER